MKRLFLSGIIFFIYLSVIAQKNVNVDNVRLPVVYKTSPFKPLNPLFFTYFTEIKATKALEKRVSMDEVYHALHIASQAKTENPENADVIVVLNLGDFIITSSKVVERREDEKDKKGNVKTKYFYHLEVRYTFEASFEAFKGNGVLEKAILANRNSEGYYSTNEYPSGREASDYWNNNRDALIGQLAKENVMKAVSYVSSTLSSNYGFPTVTDYDIIKTIDEKKHPENDAFRAASNSLKTMLEAMTPELPMDKERVNGLIEYFKSIPKKYTDPKLKADVRLRYAAYYNLCKIYIYLDEPENVPKYADLIFENGHDKGDCDKMKKMASAVGVILSRTKVKTRHFNPDQFLIHN